MADSDRILLTGGAGSPYTRKMVALLRYRQIPYSIIWGDPAAAGSMGLPLPKVVLHPTFFFKDQAGELEAVVDSTPIIRRLEQEFPGRSVIPTDPVMAFVNYLLEDFGDEWCTKYMFHYRWTFQADIDRAAQQLTLQMTPGISEQDLQKFGKQFSDRQMGRLGVVGSNEVTRPVIEGSYKRFLQLMDAHLAQHNFLFGNRPASADYGLFGQLTQLVGFDPTSQLIAYAEGPRTVAWVYLMEDQCGREPTEDDWNTEIGDTLKNLLCEVGRVYVPALLANAKAKAAGEKNWETKIDGLPWAQQTFPYQAKCLAWINEEYQTLSEPEKARVDAILAGTGCDALIQAGKETFGNGAVPTITLATHAPKHQI